MRIIDGGSGYLCEMEPVAHFGLGNFLCTLYFIDIDIKYIQNTLKHTVQCSILYRYFLLHVLNTN